MPQGRDLWFHQLVELTKHAQSVGGEKTDVRGYYPPVVYIRSITLDVCMRRNTEHHWQESEALFS